MLKLTRSQANLILIACIVKINYIINGWTNGQRGRWTDSW